MLYASGQERFAKGCFARFDQIIKRFLINMAFADYLLENAIWCFPGVGYLHTFLSLTVVFCTIRPAIT